MQEDLIAALKAGIEQLTTSPATGDGNTGDAILNRDAGPLSGIDLATLYWLVRRSNSPGALDEMGLLIPSGDAGRGNALAGLVAGTPGRIQDG